VSARQLAASPVAPTTLPADPSAVLVSGTQASQLAGGISRRTMDALIAEGKFPRPVPLLTDSKGRSSRVAWVLSEVLAFNRERIAAARGKR
jgi:predicted DNA-binding transcriptional regulator AlpA